jgi:hypothetical protein
MLYFGMQLCSKDFMCAAELAAGAGGAALFAWSSRATRAVRFIARCTCFLHCSF